MLAVAPLTSFQPDELAAELTRLRKDAHLSQRRLAELAGVSHSAIASLEAEQAPPPHPAALMKLASGLATSGSGALDERRSEAHYVALMRAAGYIPKEAVPVTPDEAFRREAQAVLGADDGELLDAIVKKVRNRPANDRQSVLRIVDILVASLPPLSHDRPD